MRSNEVPSEMTWMETIFRSPIMRSISSQLNRAQSFRYEKLAIVYCGVLTYLESCSTTVEDGYAALDSERATV